MYWLPWAVMAVLLAPTIRYSKRLDSYMVEALTASLES